MNYKIEKMYKLDILLPLEVFSSTLHLTRQPEGPSVACDEAYSIAVLYLLGTKQISLILIPEPQNRENFERFGFESRRIVILRQLKIIRKRRQIVGVNS